MKGVICSAGSVSPGAKCPARLSLRNEGTVEEAEVQGRCGLEACDGGARQW